MVGASWSELESLAQRNGIDRLGVCRVTSWTATRRQLEQRAALGYAADMSFTFRNPSRSTEPRRLLAEPRSLVVGATAVPEATATTDGVGGRVARYAASDAFDRLIAGLGVLRQHLLGEGYRARVLADDNGLVDREAAFRAGLGWFGKNALLLVPGLGSNVVLGSVVTDAYLERAAEPVADGCGTCSRCMTGCPTGAIRAPGVVDARRCLSWLLQSPEPFPVEYRRALGDRVYGCDECQAVCPPNRVADRREPRRVDGGVVDVIELLACDDEELLERCGRWYIPDRDPTVVRRNLLLVLGNTAAAGDRDALAAAAVYLAPPDGDLAEYARWTIEAIGTAAVASPGRRDEDGGP